MADQIFISYRRSGGDTTAKLIQERLINEGFTVFYDRDSLHSGYFDEKIFSAIKTCKDFILILPPNALDRCIDDGDWVRKEIQYALQYKKNIIPIIIPGFNFPENLPEDIEIVSRIQGVDFNISYFDAMIESIIRDRLKSKPVLKSDINKRLSSNDLFSKFRLNKRLIIIGSTCIAAVIALICMFAFSEIGRQLLCSHSFENTITEPTCTEEGLSCLDCTKCARHEENTLPPLDHSYQNWITDKEATEFEVGSKHAFCERCGERKDTAFYLSASEGLEYERIGDHYALVGVGSCTNENIVIPPTVDGYPVTEIATKAFQNNTIINSVVIPEGVITIEKKAFAGCSSLKEVYMPKSLVTIENAAFRGCFALESIVIPENVKSIGNWTFEMCKSLKNISLPNSIEKIEAFSFCGLFKLESIYYDGSIEEWRRLNKFRVDFLYMNRIFDIHCTDGSFSVTEDIISIFK